MPALLRYIGEQTGIAGFEHAPWIPYGKSSVGAFPYSVAWLWPARTIATISFQAETLKDRNGRAYRDKHAPCHVLRKKTGRPE
jgi:hypothetical protein